MINAMVWSAGNTGSFVMSNPKVNRPILGMPDLLAAIDRCIESDAPGGIYNLASFNATVEEVAASVVKETGAQPIRGPDSDGYDVAVDCSRAKLMLGIHPACDAGSIIRCLIKAGCASKPESHRRDPRKYP